MTPRRDIPVVLGLCLLTAVGQASVGSVAEVKLVGGRVHIQATAATVAEVLDRLAHTTGMKVVYEGAPPSDRLTAAIDAGSETEALSRLLEGLGLTYAFKLDAAGRHVETLFLTSSSSTRRASTGTSSSMSSAPRLQFQPTADDYEAADNLPPEGPDAGNDPALVPDATGLLPGNPGYAGGQVGGMPVPGVVPGVEEQNPSFPGAASFPGSGSPAPANPGQPAFPGPASYP